MSKVSSKIPSVRRALSRLRKLSAMRKALNKVGSVRRVLSRIKEGRRKRGRDQSSDRNILIISDLHLGEGLRAELHGVPSDTATGVPDKDERYQHLRRLEQELSTFFLYYTANRIKDRPWRLVINGDMVDFMSILLFPKSAPAPAEVVSGLRSGNVWGEEEVFGLGTGEAPSLVKLKRVIDHHEPVFRLLARFIAAGNDLVIVLGNHDMEFTHRAVQQAFVDRLAALAEDPGLPTRVQFCPWFYYEKNFIYIEHGHQYDEYCSFDYQLCPAASTGGLALSFAHAGMRFFGNLVPSYDQRTAEHWGMVDYVRWGLSLGLRTMIFLTYMYGLLAWKAKTIGTLLSHPKEDGLRRKRHHSELRRLSQTYRIQEEKLVALDDLRVPMAIRRLAKILSVLFIDRVLLGALGLVALVVTLIACHGAWKLCGVAGVAAAGLALNWGLSRYRGQTSPAALRRVTRDIHRITKAPVIVFGHSHEPERVELAEGAVYYNTGAWMEGGGAHTGTHLVVLPNLHDGHGPRAELRRWRDGEAVKLEL